MFATMLTPQDRRAFRATSGLAMTPDGRWLIAWSDHGARIFDAAQPGPALWSSSHVVRRLAASDRCVAYVTRSPHQLVVVDVTAAPYERAVIALPAAPRQVAAAGERVVVITEDGALRCVDLLASGEVEVRELVDGAFDGEALCLSEDGRWIAAVSRLRAGRATQVCWIDAEALRVAQLVKHARGGISALRFTPDAQRLVAAAGGAVCVWSKPRVTARELVRGLNLPELLALSGAGRLIVLDPGAALICVDVVSGAELWRQPAARVAAAAGDEVVAFEAERLLRRDAHTGALRGSCAISGAARALVVDAERGLAHVAASAGPLLRVWPLAEDALVLSPQAHGDEVVCAASSGRWLALGTMEGVVALHDLEQPSDSPHILLPPTTPDKQPCGWIHIEADADALWVAVGGSLTRWRLSDCEAVARATTQRLPLRALVALPSRGLIAAMSQARYGYGALVIYAMETLEIVHHVAIAEAIDQFMLDEDGVTLWLMHSFRSMVLHLDTYVLSAPMAARAQAEAEGWRADQTLDRATNRQEHWLVRGDVRIACAPLVSGPLVWGARLATLHQDATLCMWDAETGALLERRDAAIGAPARLFVWADGVCVACGIDGSAQLWRC